MQSKNGDWFKYSHYWGTWNRVLLRRGGEYSVQIELSLTPTHSSDDWDRVKRIIIREHRTTDGVGDKWTHHLPESVVEKMKEKMTDEQFHTLVHVDLLSMVDMDRCRDANDHPGLPGLKNYLTLPDASYQISHLVAGGAGTSLVPFLEFTGIQPKVLDGYTPDMIPLGGVYDNQVEGVLSIYGFYNPTTRYFQSNIRIHGKAPSASLLLVAELSHTNPWEMSKQLLNKLDELLQNVYWLDTPTIPVIKNRINMMGLAGQWEKYVKYAV